MSNIHFSDYTLEKDTQYFLYIGELKNYGLNEFLREALGKQLKRKIDFIAIVPDVCEQYNYANLVVINPMVETVACRYGSPANCRISSSEFARCVSDSPEIHQLIEQVLSNQEHLYIYMYESLIDLSLDELDRVSILGPDKTIARKMNNKTVQMTSLKDMVPVVEFRACPDFKALKETCDLLWNQWVDGIFVTKEFSAAGINSTLAFCEQDIMDKFNGEKVPYLISRYIPHDFDPTVLGVVANEEDVYIAGVADQRIEGGNRFTGSVFPSVLPENIVEKLKTYTRTVGKWLGKQGYRGIFGCDYIVTEKNEIFFLEINARKQGTTIEFCCMLEQLLPEGVPMLPGLEYFAVTKNQFPANTIEMGADTKDLHWGTFNYKIHSTVKTITYIPQGIQERQAFEKVVSHRLKKDFLILEHAGSDFVIAEGSFIARIVALGHDRGSVAQGIDQGCKTIELTFAPQP